MSDYITLVDYYSFFYRASLVKFTNQLSYNNEITGILFSLIRSYTYIIKNYRNVIFCFDKHTSLNYKKQLYHQYKENRKEKYKEYILKDIYKYKDILNKIVPFYYSQNTAYEGDDVIASLSYKFKNNNIKVIILTVDSDIWQLTDFNKIIVHDMRNKYKPIDIKYFKEKFNNLLLPQLIPLYKTIFGDKSDNISSSIKQRIKKQKIISLINNIYLRKNNNNNINISNRILFFNILKEIYKNNTDLFICSLSELENKLNIILLEPYIETDINFSDGNKEEYIKYCKKYNYKKVLPYDEILKYFNKNTSYLKKFIKLNSSINELL